MAFKFFEKKDSKVVTAELDIEEGRTSPPPKPPLYNRLLAKLYPPNLWRNYPQESLWPSLIKRAFQLLAASLILGALATIILTSLLSHLAHKLSPPPIPSNGLTSLVASWKEPGQNPSQQNWIEGFSRDVYPKNIHSHNDYTRRVPLFEALSLGIRGVEADCHLVNGEIYIDHKANSPNPNRTLKSLYINPLFDILTQQNKGNSISNSTGNAGVFSTDPETSIILLTDLKTDGVTTLQAVQDQLAPLREAGWLTYWNGTAIVPGPIIHVATGNTQFSSILNSSYSNSTYRDVFFDAPLESLSSAYNISNSYYASTSVVKLSGGRHKIGFHGLSPSQMDIVKMQIKQAEDLGLMSRYWDIPGWPVSERMNIWKQLMDTGIGMLNVDDIYLGARWNWRWCNILGLELC